MYAQSKNSLSLTISPFFSNANGQINEYVFNKECTNTDNKESQLDWDLKNIPIFGIDCQINLNKTFTAIFQISMGLPKKSGNMQDYDWLNFLGGKHYPYPSSWLNDKSTEITNYSKHNNFLTQYINLFISAGRTFYLPKEIKTTPYLAYQYDFFSFDAKDGYGTYKIDNWAISEFSGKVITYQQVITALLIGFNFQCDAINHLHFDADFNFSPALTLLNALDYHYNRYYVFWDNFTNLWQLNSKIAVQFKLNPIHKLGLFGSIHYVPASYGITSQNIINSDGTIANKQWNTYSPKSSYSGTKRFIWSAGFNYSFSL